MPEIESNAVAVAHQIELSAGQLDSLSTLAEIAAPVVQRISQPEFSPGVLSDLLACDVSLAALTLKCIARCGVQSPGLRFSFQPAVERLPGDALRDALLSAPVLDEALAFDQERAKRRRALTRHSVAVACCARRIAELTMGWTDPELAYFGGLLHDIGKLMIDEAMPRSHAKMVDQARVEIEALHPIERRSLGTDHALLGKHLARKWGFPGQVVNAIWLHHSDLAGLARSIADSDTARVVQLADAVTRQAQIGHSGNYHAPDRVEALAASISIEASQLNALRDDLSELVRGRLELLDLDSTTGQSDYLDALRQAAKRFARRESALTAEIGHAGQAQNYLAFAAELLSSVDASTDVVDMAREFAQRWQKSFQTGKVCLYINEFEPSHGVRAVVVRGLNETTAHCLDMPADEPLVWPEMAGGFSMTTGVEGLDWLTEQFDATFDAGRTVVVPLSAGRRVTAVLAFEANYPVDPDRAEDIFKKIASLGGGFIGAVLAREQQERLVERFVQTASVRRGSAPASTNGLLDALAELAGGAAHELNNPLAVISGRAQLLAEAETDQEKREILRQIHENAGQASAIIEDLMSFAEPPKPRPAATDVQQIIDEAMQLAGRKITSEKVEMESEVDTSVVDVFVDSAQIVSALANIIANAAESYGDQAGRVTIGAQVDRAKEAVILQVEDKGCGMNAEICRKATQPFFSAKPAGRKRGMGLAYAHRFIQINGGQLTIDSRPGEGTLVHITLPTHSA